MENERFDEILQYLKENKSATVETLSKLLYTSEATVRRDLKKMHAAGLIERVHGGAYLDEKAGELSHILRSKKNESGKREVAKLAVDVLPSFNTLFIDSSTTCLYLIEKLNLGLKTVVTNSILSAEALSKIENCNTILLGGAVDGHTGSVIGSLTFRQLDDFCFDLAICSCAAISDGYTFERTVDVGEVKKKALSKSRRKILLVDGEKFSSVGAYRGFPLEFFDCVVTDVKPPKEYENDAIKFVYPEK